NLVLQHKVRSIIHTQRLRPSLHADNYSFEEITVKANRVAPSASERARINQEREITNAIYALRSDQPWWLQGLNRPLTSKITSPFGTQRMFNAQLQSYHSGVDYRAAMNTPIRAAQAGIVRLARELFYAGRCVIL